VAGLSAQKTASPLMLSDISPLSGKRTGTGIKELDRALGGGVVRGSVVLIGGEPGIGKSTLILQALNGLSNNGRVLYVSGEESPEQIKMRAERLGVVSDNIIILPETSLEGIVSVVQHLNPHVIVIDSIQTTFSVELPSTPGSVGQIRECATRLMFLAKRDNIPLFLIGHVTKEGAIAGPKVLEHIVDTVLYFEGDRGSPFRILRAVKNRFGSTNEIGVFEMTEKGLIEVDNPSELFLSDSPYDTPGSVVTVCLEGTRPILVEVQALVATSNIGVPRRTSIGVDYNRINLLIAVLDKRLGLHLGGMDVFVNIVGGLRIDEPSVDMGVISAITSSLRDRAIERGVFTFGEVGLSGEIRPVNQAGVRVKEAAKLGFKKAIIPLGNSKNLNDNGIEIIGVRNIEEAFQILFF